MIREDSSVREPFDVLDAIQSTRAQRYLEPHAIPEPVLWGILDAAVRGMAILEA